MSIHRVTDKRIVLLCQLRTTPPVSPLAAAPPHALHSVVGQVHGSHRQIPPKQAPALYQARHPEQSLFYRTIADHLETWLELASSGQFDGQGDLHTPAPYVETAFRKYLECGIFAYGFARACCDACGHNFLVAFSCKGRGVCPSCNTRRMVETAAHLSDYIFPKLPVRQWVLSLPKLLRYCARPPFAMERLHRKGQDHLPNIHTAHCPKPQSGGAAIRGATIR